MPADCVKRYLDEKKIRYISTQHSPAYTAQEIAQAAKVKGGMLAKTVVVLLDGRMVLTVMPSTSRIRWDRLSNALGTDFLELADEQEFQDAFGDCELGAMPPFGNLFNMKTYLDEQLTKNEDIAFCAGSHSETIRMSMNDYLELVKPITLDKGFVRPDTPPLMRHRVGRQQLHRHA